MLNRRDICRLLPLSAAMAAIPVQQLLANQPSPNELEAFLKNSRLGTGVAELEPEIGQIQWAYFTITQPATLQAYMAQFSAVEDEEAFRQTRDGAKDEIKALIKQSLLIWYAGFTSQADEVAPENRALAYTESLAFKLNGTHAKGMVGPDLWNAER